ncbi:high-potential iron-sulfur protein [Ideonella oryzae]|uniref:High-potential iron-sulfur protein n=1 Tax=Ideonella oryzae TaxID=2937441 RepID=A0ABT1BJS8_9BURK|nr:high-potential iron-sulfur protein [Ideonella oryzae]MCO5976343.1 high-potential iron-sulfur protein [Ideonella oryzae]
MSSPFPTRRALLRALPAVCLPTAGLMPPSARAQSLPLLQEDNPAARQLGYVADAQRVDRTRFAQYAAGQTCRNCDLYGGEAADSQGGCQLFYGVEVKAAGWCSAWKPKAP